MSETFEQLRRLAAEHREGTRQQTDRDGIDPVSWEALLDRVEDQLDEDDRDGGAVPAAAPVPAQPRGPIAIPLSLFTGGALGAALVHPAVGAPGGAPQVVQCLAAGAALAGLGLAASLDRGPRRGPMREGGVAIR
ncbi:hypothetical protein CF54_23400 [Streptomyces sp. Tu 6176]|uniref:hypothetical protein n=1 Tax=Streptomyces sp. Tu 6176 TaxID=1470557 RepID=UPI0004530B7A|nr:hypothetical protein [Streptomyces sp. Tu 6176]EYT80794.1 hypothetical protein CF54_23400 [Streptomyces sp. Tu 6176]